MSISEQLREAIRARGETHYRIAKDSGVNVAVIDRFVSGERPNVMAPTIDKLCDYLGLELCEKSARKKAAKKVKRNAKKK